MLFWATQQSCFVNRGHAGFVGLDSSQLFREDNYRVYMMEDDLVYE
jgi:hypothetical protein